MAPKSKKNQGAMLKYSLPMPESTQPEGRPMIVCSGDVLHSTALYY